MTRPVNLLTFPGAPNLPIFVALDQGLFEKHGLDVTHTTTPSSIFQFQCLADGRADIAGTAFDNVVAYREHQGAADLDGPLDVFAFMGASQIELSLVAGPGYTDVASLAGHGIAMDALDTGFAFVLYDMLAHAGVAADAVTLAAVGATPQRFEAVRDGACAATLTIDPFTAMARAAGLNVLDTSTARFDDYQGGVFAARESLAGDSPGLLDAYAAAYLEALALTLDPANDALRHDTLARHMPNIAPALLERVLTRLLSPRTGLTPGATISPAGVATVLDLRRRHHPRGDAVGALDRYVRLSSALGAPAGTS